MGNDSTLTGFMRLDDDPDILQPGIICNHCGLQMRGYASVDGKSVCHTDPPYPDCYRLITVYHERIGLRQARDPGDIV